MFEFVTKKDYWRIVESGFLRFLPKKSKSPLKLVQDTVALSYLYEISNNCIAEIGGGNSRLLRFLSKREKGNNCYNIDEFRGEGGGLQKEKKIRGVTNIKTKIGNYSKEVNNEYFDIIYSISVVEHIPELALDDFFLDCHRILKKTGLMIHLIDVYLEDSSGDNVDTSRRVCRYKSYLDNKFFAPQQEPAILSEKDVIFFSRFATNPDDTLARWNKIVPDLRDKREQAQSCTLLMIGRKV
jgi:hypothetical protein